MNDIKQKIEDRNRLRRRRAIRKGLEHLQNLKPNMKEPFDKIKSESNRKLFSKFNDDLADKRINHLKTAYNAIDEAGRNYLLRRLFKIPD